MKKIRISDIEGIEIGHAQDENGLTGCSVILCEKGAVTGVNVRGGAPGTRETDLLAPEKMIDRAHAVVLAGGSAYGLDAASGVMRYLEENNIGFAVDVGRVPIVPSAILFDLTIGDPSVRPDREMGYLACKNAGIDLSSGNIGAGLGATVGKYKGPQYAMKGGLGYAAYQIGDLKVGAMLVVNCLGDILDPETGQIIAGTLNNDHKSLANTEKLMIDGYEQEKNLFKGNTTLGIIVTNAELDKVQANQISSLAHNGLVRTIRPVHTQFDGDTLFTMSTTKIKAKVSVVELLARKAVEDAVINGVKKAEKLAGYLSFADICKDDK
jgi:L-aminopeptidase/D-esterase-like protein